MKQIPRTHIIKCWKEYFPAIKSGIKNFELRKDDRGYLVGDYLLIREYCNETNSYTGRCEDRLIDFIIRAQDFPEIIKEGFVIMSISKVNNQ